jgi:serine kinase of HPr protein (carbohydrate metabolism regulator)
VTQATIHASAALVGERGVLIRGATGSGKSSLLMALIFGEARATLIADDRVVLSVAGGRLFAAAPEAIAGRMEVRGVGIVDLPYVSPAEIALVVDLAPLAECPRLPDESEAHIDLRGVMLRRIFVAIGAADAAYRVRAALAAPLG